MNTASILIKTDPETKKQAQEAAAELGVSLSAMVSDLLKEVVKKKSINMVNEELTPYAKAQLKKAKKNRLEGKGSPIFTSEKELIKKDPKKYRHIDTMEQWFEEQGI